MSIPGISHALSKDVKASLTSLQFSLEETDQNPRIGGLLSQSVLDGGKRLRPLLTILMGDMFGVEHNDISPFARVVELVHAATLAHDDVIDSADTRRGNPSINAIASNKKAVLAGDYLLAYSLMEVARFNRPKLVSCLAEIISDLAEGEWIQIENSESQSLTETDIELVALKKTGSVLRWCAQAAPLYLDLEDSIITLAREFGETLGVAFQMTDDILDFKRQDGAEFADLKNKVINSVIFTNICKSRNVSVVDALSIQEISIDKSQLEESIAVVRQKVRMKLERCKAILLMLMDEPIELEKKQKRDEAFFALTCIIEYLSNRV